MTLKTAFILGRVSNVPTVWTNVVAALVISHSALKTPYYENWPVLLLVCFSVTLLYIGGMYLNDAFDREVDSIERPSRPIPLGLAKVNRVFTAGYAMLAAGIAGLGFVAFYQGSVFTGFLFALLLGGSILLYDMRHKNNPFSPLIMGLCRALVYISVAFAFVKMPLYDNWDLYAAAFVLWCYIVGLSYIARQESLSHVKNLWPLALLLAPVGYAVVTTVFGQIQLVNRLEVFLLSASLVSVIGYSFFWLRNPGNKRISHAVSVMISGICFVDALVMSLHGASFCLWVGAGGFVLTLFFQKWIPGT